MLTRLASLAIILAATIPAQTELEERRKAAVDKMRAEQLAKTTAVVRGRCVDGRTGKPLAGCKIGFRGRPSNRGAMARHGKVQWEDPAPIVTGADGKFAFRFVPPPPFQHSINFSCPGKYPRTGRWGAFQTGQIDDLGDVPFYPGFSVQGKVVNQRGQPLARVYVSFSEMCLPLGMKPGELGRNTRNDSPKKSANDSHWAANDSRGGRTGADGTFTTSVLLPPGTWPLDVSFRGCTLVSPKRFTISQDGTHKPLVVVVREEPSLSGRVVDLKGKPVRGVYLRAEQHQSGRMASAYSRADGTFKIYRTNTVDKSAVKIKISDPMDCEAPEGPTKPYKWGATDIKIVLRRALSFPLQVVEAGTDKPVTNFSIQCHRPDANSSRYLVARLGGVHPEGRVVVDRVWRGANVLRVIPNDPRYGVPDFYEFRATDKKPGPAKIELTRLFPLKVVVRDPNNQPAVGYRVQLIRPGDRPFDSSTWVRDPRTGGMSFSSRREAELICETKTDALGQCIVYGLENSEDSILRVGKSIPHPSRQLPAAQMPRILEDIVIGRQHLRQDVQVDGAAESKKK